MEDVLEPQAPAPPSRRSISVNGVPVDGEGSAFFPHPFGRTGTEGSTASPDEESEDRTEDDASIYGSIEVVRQYSATPPTEDLPIYNVKPWYQSRRVRKLADESPEFGDFLLGHIRGQTTTVHHAQEELREQYAKDYESYLRFTLSDDPAAVKSRDYFTSSGVQTGTNGKTTGSDSKPEGGRRAAGRFSTELDLDYAIQQSMREHQEKQEREERAQKEKYRSDKEAVIPDMFWTDEEKDQASYYDTAGALPLEKVIASWQVAPWHNNFSAEEAERFEKAYLEFPKQWGKIAKELPNRDFGACIQYYYAKKRELNLKEKLKKQPRRRKKGRGKQRSSALVSELGNIENENEETAQENGENGERRRPPRRAAAPNFGNEVASNADSDGTTPTATPGRRRAGTAADAKNESGAEKPEPAKRGGRKGRQPKADKEAKGPKLLAQAPGAIPSAVAGKTGRSRGNSRAQNPEWVGSPSTPLDLASRTPVPFEVPPGGMQPPLTSPDRGMPPIASTISEVMAPPSLRPEPPPPPASVPTFEIAPPAGPERIRTPQQASSYWSVSETTDFPGLLRAFGTDWASIAGYMQTKTATMVKNYYVRQTKEGGKPEWEQIAMEADSKRSRGEKRPAPPTPTQGPRKRYDVPSAGHRPLAAAEPEDGATAKVETPTQNPGFTRFQVPIAQVPAFSYAEREPVPAPAQPPAQAQQPVRISQKPIPVATPAPPVSESVARPAGWAGDLDAQYSMLAQQKELRDRQRMDLAQREQARPIERAPPLRMKQEPEQAMHHPEAYPQFQQQQRVMSSRIEPAPPTLARQPEPPRTQPYAPPTHAQPVQSLLSDPVAMQQAPPPPAPGHERSLSGIRATPVSMQEHYPTTPVSAPGPPPPNPRPQLMPPSSRPPERKTSSLMALLNDDPPPPPKRVNDVSSAVKPSSTPPPQSMSLRQPPPTSAPGPSRREVEAGYPYARNPPSGPTTAIPPLKPYHTQSPQPQHMRVPSSSMAPTIDPAAAEAQRDYYGRHPYPPQHQTSATNSPQLHPTHHYAPSGPQHPQQHSPQHAQQPPMGYQGQQQPYQPYQVSQAHAASPTPQYAPHPSMSGRREPAPLSARESWPQASAAQQQQQMHHQQQQAAWPPSHQAPPKSSQPPVPAQSAWGAQHGVQAKPPVSSALPPQQHHTWPSSGPSQQPHPLNLREPRGSAVYGSHEAQSPTAGMVHHQHTGSLGSGSRYAPPPQQDTRRPGEPVPPPQAAAQPPYARYSNTPGPAQQTRADPGRSYTPVSAFDPRGPPGPPQGGPPPPQGAGGYPPQQQQQQRQQQEQQEAAMRDVQMREAQMREMQQREMQQREMQQREMQQREMQQREMQQQRDPREAPPPPPQSILGRQLRPQDPYERGGGERRY